MREGGGDGERRGLYSREEGETWPVTRHTRSILIWEEASRWRIHMFLRLSTSKIMAFPVRFLCVEDCMHDGPAASAEDLRCPNSMYVFLSYKKVNCVNYASTPGLLLVYFLLPAERDK